MHKSLFKTFLTANYPSIHMNFKSLLTDWNTLKCLIDTQNCINRCYCYLNLLIYWMRYLQFSGHSTDFNFYDKFSQFVFVCLFWTQRFTDGCTSVSPAKFSPINLLLGPRQKKIFKNYKIWYIPAKKTHFAHNKHTFTHSQFIAFLSIHVYVIIVLLAY